MLRVHAGGDVDFSGLTKILFLINSQDLYLRKCFHWKAVFDHIVGFELFKLTDSIPLISEHSHDLGHGSTQFTSFARAIFCSSPN